MQKFVVIAAAMIATMGAASAGSVTPAGCSTCILNAQPYNGVTTPFTLEDLGTATIPNSRQPIASPVSFPGEVITFPAAGSGVYAGWALGGGSAPPMNNTTSNYLSAISGDSGVTITFAVPQHQINLLWGSVGVAPFWRDQLILVFDDGSTGTILGDDVALAASLNFPGDAPVEITTTKSFTTAVFNQAIRPSFEFVPAVPVVLFAGTPGKANCVGQSVSALSSQFGGLVAAPAGLGFAGVEALQSAITTYCGG